MTVEVEENVENASPAYKAGLREGDRIVKIDATDVNGWEDVLKTVGGYKKEDQKLDFEIIREGERIPITVSPQMTKLMNAQGQEEERFTIGIYSAGAVVASPEFVMQTWNPIKAIGYGIHQSVRWTGLTLISFVRLIENKVSVKNVGGVITIGRVASQSFEMGLAAFLKIMGIISINLFILNLLPIPVLDGGHLVFFTIEALKGAPLSLRKMEIAQTVGMVLLMGLMLFALFNYVNNWYNVQGW
ncbi:MAG: RIP metalloprotease RseP [Bdellovibrionales bacterium]